MRRNLERFIQNRERIVESLEQTKMFYRQYDPGWYLYRKIVSESEISAKFSKPFIELIYVTLAAWNMNSRGAKLADWDTFRSSIVQHKRLFVELANHRIDRLSEKQLEDLLKSNIKKLFFNLTLVAEAKPRLVTYSKTIHFMLPKLLVPIDRKYTLNYFYKHGNVPRSIERQFELFCEIQMEFRRFCAKVPLGQFRDRIWNANIPKTMDNIIIGYLK
jgi:hypothetical protein